MWLNLFKSLKLDFVKYDESLKKYNTFSVGGIADVIAFPSTIEELLVVLNFIKQYKVNYMILGNGSNVIFSSNRFEGIIIKLDKFNNIVFEDNKVTVDAGYSFIKFSNELCNKGISSFEFATGIPGSIGGAVYMNAGAYKSSISDVLDSVTFLDDKLKIKTIKNKDCKFGYRDSIFKHKNYIILSAKFNIKKGNVDEIKALVEDRRERRLSTQPIEQKSAGSTFRNPEEVPAWKVIDECGLRGKRIGGVSVSTKHSNFIVNDNEGTGEDIKELIDLIKEEVKKNKKIDLVLEQELINF